MLQKKQREVVAFLDVYFLKKLFLIHHMSFFIAHHFNFCFPVHRWTQTKNYQTEGLGNIMYISDIV